MKDEKSYFDFIVSQGSQKRPHTILSKEIKGIKKPKLSNVSIDNYFLKLSNIIYNSCYANAVLQLILSCGIELFNKVNITFY